MFNEKLLFGFLNLGDDMYILRADTNTKITLPTGRNPQNNFEFSQAAFVKNFKWQQGYNEGSGSITFTAPDGTVIFTSSMTGGGSARNETDIGYVPKGTILSWKSTNHADWMQFLSSTAYGLIAYKVSEGDVVKVVKGGG